VRSRLLSVKNASTRIVDRASRARNVRLYTLHMESSEHAVQLARVVCWVKFCHSAELAARVYLNERGVPFSAASMLTR
jgi:hypothetical protein